MKTIFDYISESGSNEIKTLQDKIKNLNLSEIFNGQYDLTHLDIEFYKILRSLNSPMSSDKALIGTWKMLFSKLLIEPMVVELLDKNKCVISTIQQDRTEKWDIKYNNIYIDVKTSFNSRTRNFGLDNQTCEYILTSNNAHKYILFLYPEIRTWDDYINVYKNKKDINMYLISFADMKELLQKNIFISKSNTTLIPLSYIEASSKFRKNKE